MVDDMSKFFTTILLYYFDKLTFSPPRSHRLRWWRLNIGVFGLRIGHPGKVINPFGPARFNRLKKKGQSNPMDSLGSN
jgi:hypothetical protein